MRSVSIAVRWILAWGALCALLSGCSHQAAERPSSPNMSPSDYRQAMIRWHQQHDRQPAAPVPGK